VAHFTSTGGGLHSRAQGLHQHTAAGHTQVGGVLVHCGALYFHGGRTAQQSTGVASPHPNEQTHITAAQYPWELNHHTAEGHTHVTAV